MKKIFGVFFLVAFITMFSSCGKVSEVKKLKIGHGLDKSHPVHKAMLFLEMLILLVNYHLIGLKVWIKFQ